MTTGRALRYVYCFLLIAFGIHNAIAQKAFTEGTLRYNITLEPAGNYEGIQQYNGTYTLVLKGKRMRENINLSNGFSYSTLLNMADSSAYTLKKAADRYYAIELDPQQRNEEKKRYSGFNLSTLQGNRTISGINAKHGLVTYKDGSSTEIYYTDEWTAENVFFEMFPGITVLPLEYTFKRPDGLSVSFKLTSVDEEPVENALFKIPKNYRIMSYKEYEALTK